MHTIEGVYNVKFREVKNVKFQNLGVIKGLNILSPSLLPQLTFQNSIPVLDEMRYIRLLFLAPEILRNATGLNS